MEPMDLATRLLKEMYHGTHASSQNLMEQGIQPPAEAPATAMTWRHPVKSPNRHWTHDRGGPAGENMVLFNNWWNKHHGVKPEENTQEYHDELQAKANRVWLEQNKANANEYARPGRVIGNRSFSTTTPQVATVDETGLPMEDFGGTRGMAVQGAIPAANIQDLTPYEEDPNALYTGEPMDLAWRLLKYEQDFEIRPEKKYLGVSRPSLFDPYKHPKSRVNLAHMPPGEDAAMRQITDTSVHESIHDAMNDQIRGEHDLQGDEAHMAHEIGAYSAMNPDLRQDFLQWMIQNHSNVPDYFSPKGSVKAPERLKRHGREIDDLSLMSNKEFEQWDNAAKRFNARNDPFARYLQGPRGGEMRRAIDFEREQRAKRNLENQFEHTFGDDEPPSIGSGNLMFAPPPSDSTTEKIGYGSDFQDKLASEPMDIAMRLLKQRRRLGAGRAPRRKLGRDWTDPTQTTMSQLTDRHRAKAEAMHEQFPEPPEGLLNWLRPSWRKQRAEHQAARKRTAERENQEMSQWLSNWNPSDEQNPSSEDTNMSTLVDEYQRLGLLDE